MNTGLAGKRSFVLVLGALTAIAAVSVDMITPTFPEMVRDLVTTMSTGQKVVGLFMAGLAAGQIPAGLFSDRIGRMPVIYGGMAVFAVACLVCATTHSIEIMLIGRFLQGFGGSVGVVISRAIVRDIASGAQAAHLMSIMMMIFTAAPMLAPVAGSLLVFQWGWRGPFVAVTVYGIVMLVAIRLALQETHSPSSREHPVRQLNLGLREFFSHRRSVLGLLLLIFPSAGFISLLTGSSAIIMEIYGYPVQAFGLIFSTWGLSILIGSGLNRRLILVHGVQRMIGMGASMIGIAALQLLLIAWIGHVNFWWFWGNILLFMFGVSILMPNATATALDPVPDIAGMAASIIGALQALSATLGSLISSAMYDGTIRNVAIMMGLFGSLAALTALMRPVILGSQEVIGPDH
jgi:DHA1 family bicyclomycin/chloramphenicol resistance-like MFS transporter